MQVARRPWAAAAASRSRPARSRPARARARASEDVPEVDRAGGVGQVDRHPGAGAAVACTRVADGVGELEGHAGAARQRSRSEQGGIIKDGAKMVNAMSNSTVPKFTVIVGNSFGAGNYAMCGKAYDPRLIVAWPTAKIAVMGGEAAAKTLLQIEVASQKAKGKELSPEAEAQLLQSIKAKYEEQMSPYYAAARLWIDDIIDPLNTRTLLSEGIAAANNNPDIPSLRTGVFQV